MTKRRKAVRIWDVELGAWGSNVLYSRESFVAKDVHDLLPKVERWIKKVGLAKKDCRIKKIEMMAEGFEEPP